MTPAAIPVVKRSLRAFDVAAATDAARRALRARSVDEVDAVLAPMADAMHKAATAPQGKNS
jgi:phosphoenolpyruvate-protein kinase (PTS system EI component)